MAKIKLKEIDITRFLHSRISTLVVIFMSVAATLFIYNQYDVPTFSDNSGLLFSSFGQENISPSVSFWLNLIVYLGITVLLIYSNRVLSFIKGLTSLFAALFIAVIAALPMMTHHIFSGTLVCLIVVAAMLLLFSVDQHPVPQHHAFLAFLLLSIGTFIQWGLAMFMPIFILGCVQMRILRQKTVLAIILGIITPYWLVFGLGVADFSSFQIPVSRNSLTDISAAQTTVIYTHLALTSFIGLLFALLNTVKILSADQRSRAFNGFIVLMTLTSTILAVADYYNMMSYLPLISCCAALNCGQFFTLNMTRRSYIPILIIILAYAAICVSFVAML